MLSLRLATPADIPVLLDFRLAQLREEGAPSPEELAPAVEAFYTRHFADDAYAAVLAEDDGIPVGTGGISMAEKPPYPQCPTGRLALLSGMYTAPAARRQGVARAVLARLLEEARARGCGVVQITASAAGAKLYEAMGFQRHERFFQLRL